MELIVVYVLCVAVALNFVKDTHSVPVSGILSGLFGGDEVHPKQQPAAAVAPVDINQLLRQYYTAQSEEQMARYNPFGQINSAVAYGPPQQYDPYAPPPAAEQYFAYQNSNPFQNNPYQSPYAPDPYSQQLYPVYRGGPAQLPSGVDDGGVVAAAAADHFSKQLDSLLPKDGVSAQALADISSYRSLSAPSQVDARSPSASQVREVAESRPPVASSLVSHRVLPDEAADKPVQAKASSAPKSVESSQKE